MSRTDSAPVPAQGRDRTQYLYIAVLVAVGLGVLVGLLFPAFAVQLKWLGTFFVNLIKMMISPIIFCTSSWASARSGRRPASARSAAWRSGTS